MRTNGIGGEKLKLLWTSLLAVSILVAASPFAPARPTDIRVAYTGGTPFGPGAFDDECASSSLLKTPGVVCVALPKGASTMTFVVDDKSDLPVGGTYYLYDAAGEPIAAATHCGTGSTSLEGAAFAVVRLELINGPLVCAAEGLGFGEATRGFVSFALR